jgi:hypothetical protein
VEDEHGNYYETDCQQHGLHESCSFYTEQSDDADLSERHAPDNGQHPSVADPDHTLTSSLRRLVVVVSALCDE